MNEHRDGPAETDEEELLHRWYAASARAKPIPSDELLVMSRRAPRRRTARNLAATAAIAMAVLVAIAAVGTWAEFRAASIPSAAAPATTASGTPSISPNSSATLTAGPMPSGPQPGYLAGSVQLSGSSALMTLYGGLKRSDDTGRTWTDVPYPAGVTSDQPILTATAPGRPIWLAVPSGDGYRVYSKPQVSAEWLSVLLTSTAALLRTGGNVVSMQLFPGPGHMVAVQEFMADSSAVFFVSSDDGASFVQRQSPASSLMDMAWDWPTFTTLDSGVAIELTGHSESAHPFLHTTDGGKTWSDAKVTGLPGLNSYRLGRPRLVGSDIEVPIDTGNDGKTSRFFLLISHDGGATFSPLGVRVDYEPTLKVTWGLHTWYVAFDTLGSVTWWAADGGIIEVTTDGGQTWTAVKAKGLPIGFNTFAELAVTGLTSATAIVSADGQTGNVSWAKEYLMTTTDGGRTWARV